MPFTGGAVGYLGYDLYHFIERLPATAVDDLGLVECYLGFYGNLLAKVYIISTGFPEMAGASRAKRAAL